MDYDEAVSYLSSAPRFTREPSLATISELMRRLGDPQKHLRTVNIAGTNGKGSTTAMLASVLSSAGYKTGRYISPFVIEFRERMCIDGEMIPKSTLAELVTKLSFHVDSMRAEGWALSVFEMTTATAYLWFAEESCDIVCLEAGLGGRLDATNIIEHPEVSVITSVSLDHTEILGKTIAAIAFEKCGIMRPGGVTVVAPRQHSEALEVIMRRSDENGGTLICCSAAEAENLVITLDGSRFRFGALEVAIPLVGAHQITNAITALNTVFALRTRGFSISDEAILSGMAHATFPARLEVCGRQPLIILDGAHNAEGAATLAAVLKALVPQDKTLILGMMADKDCPGVISLLAPLCCHVICVPVKNPRALPPEKLANIAAEFCFDVRVSGNACDALSKAILSAPRDSAIIIAGSLYLASELRPFISPTTE